MAQDEQKRQYDEHLVESFSMIINTFNIKTYIETGYRDAYNIKYIQKKFPNVICHGAEIDNDYCNKAEEYLKEEIDNKHVFLYKEDCLEMLRKISRSETEEPILFFLDANSTDIKYWPVMDELNIIKDNFQKYVVCIHDFENPKGNYKKLDMSTISNINNFLNSVESYQIRYNNKAAYGWGSLHVGAIFIWVGFNNIGNFSPK